MPAHRVQTYNHVFYICPFSILEISPLTFECSSKVDSLCGGFEHGIMGLDWPVAIEHRSNVDVEEESFLKTLIAVPLFLSVARQP